MWFLIVIACLSFSLIPTIVAALRKHPKRRIFLPLNLALMASGPIASELGAPPVFSDGAPANLVSPVAFVGWIALIVWAFRSNRLPKVTHNAVAH